MKGFLQEYGIIMVVVAVVLGMLAFGKTGYAKGIQDAILGSANHIVETGENITKKKAGDLLKIEGKEYIVIEEKEKDRPLVMTASSIENRIFNSTYRADSKNPSTYEGSEIDKYLENDWYNSLSSTVKAAIQSTNIKQTSYDSGLNKQETVYGGQVYNTISRHAFLPSVSEIGKVVDLKSPDKVKAFLNGTTIWTRDSYRGSFYVAEGLSANYNRLSQIDVNLTFGVRPAFVIDLSKVDYKEVGHVDYK